MVDYTKLNCAVSYDSLDLCLKPGKAEITRHCSKCETLEALISSVRSGGFFDLHFRAHKYNIRIVHERVFHAVVVFFIVVLSTWTRDMRVVVVGRS